MTEDSIELLLTKWSVLPEDFVINFTDGYFTENEIIMKQLSQLDDNNLKELYPCVCAQIDLKTKNNQYLVSTTNTVSESSINTNTVQDDDVQVLRNILASDLYVRPEFSDFRSDDLRTLLTTSPCDPSIIIFYAKCNNFKNNHHDQLTDINHKMTYEEYNLVTAKIIALFPSENTHTYFVPPIKNHRSISENHADEILCLENNTEPWSRIIECWLATYELRKESISSNIISFIQEWMWNILNDLNGDSLFDDKQYPERVSPFYHNWKWLINMIMIIGIVSKDETVTSLDQKIQQLVDDDRQKYIKLLSNLIPPRGRSTKHR